MNDEVVDQDNAAVKDKEKWWLRWQEDFTLCENGQMTKFDGNNEQSE
jgi:hypothetical protein